MGADVKQLYALLKVRLLLDNRRPVSFNKQQNNGKKTFKYMAELSMFLYVIMGFIYIIPLFIDDFIMGLWLYYTSFLTMLSFMLISDFSTVLFDSRDQSIIGHRPINERTLILSKFLHIGIYLFRIIMPMSLAGLTFIIYEKGWLSGIWFMTTIIVLTAFVLFLVNTIYLLILHFVRLEKFKDTINYFQIVFSILFFILVYTFPKLIESNSFLTLKHTNYPWIIATPTYWIAASYSWISSDKLSHITPYIGILAYTVPFIMLWLTLKYLSPSFMSKIALIDTASTNKKIEDLKENTNKAVKQSKNKFYIILAKWFNKNNFAQASFILTWLQTDRSRNFKMRVLPSFGFVPVYFFYLITLNTNLGYVEAFRNLHNTKSYIILLYISSFIVLNLVYMITNSENYKASWIYYSSPITNPGDLMLGAFKAIWIKYFLPIFLAISLFVLYIWGIDKTIDIILAWLNITIFGIGIMRVLYRRLPFSMYEQMNEKKGRFFKSMFIMILPTSLGLAHYFTTITPWLWWMKLLFIGLALILLWLLWDSIKSTSWEDLSKFEEST